jgi:hypothetical protein
MKKTFTHFLVFLTVLALAACSFQPGGSEFERARTRWQEHAPVHYRYQLQVGCFCPFADRMPLTIEVRDGQTVSILAADGSPVSADEMSMFERYATIDKLFDLTGAALDGDADKVEVTYDEKYGFPVQVNIDYIEQAVDDELGLQVSAFEVLP